MKIDAKSNYFFEDLATNFTILRICLKLKYYKLEQSVEQQKEKILKGNPFIEIVKPCRNGDGINVIDEQKNNFYIKYFDSIKSNIKTAYFIPASGSGSRMFGQLYNYLEGNPNDNTIEFIEQLLNNIQNFAFYNKLPQYFKKDIKTGKINIESLIKFILYEEGLNFGQLPKGLIPFHLYGKFIINPFQEQILQGVKVASENTQFNFTINQDFEKNINHSIKILKEITGVNFSYQFSIQDKKTHSVAFNNNNEIVVDESNQPILRPSGHGALIDNLNAIDADLIFIKNIDNVQHYSKAKKSINTAKTIGGLLVDFKQKVDSLLTTIDAQSSQIQIKATELNNNFNLGLSEKEISNSDTLKTFFNRPIRICGMVKNEGQPGGGPFFVKNDDGKITPQIIEKSQIKNNQLSILLHATHFNPVFMACAVKNYKKIKFDLTQYVNKDLYFIVHKNEKGKSIKYIENPGLWNGGMYNWLTLFYEIDSDCFSPVKTVLDLLKPLHVDTLK